MGQIILEAISKPFLTRARRINPHEFKKGKSHLKNFTLVSTGGLPQGLIIAQFSLFNNNLYNWAGSTLSKCEDVTNMAGVIVIADGCAAVQRDLNSLERWANTKLMTVNREKGQVLHLRRNSPMHAEGQPDGEQLCRKGDGGPYGQQVGHKPAMSLYRKESQQPPKMH